MKLYDMYLQTDPEEITSLIHTSPMALLITHQGERLQSGVFNPIFRDGRIFLHLNKTDEQVLAMQKQPRAQMIFFDHLCNIPSHWVDKHYGGAATSYYRFAQLDCEVKLHTEPEKVAQLLQGFLDHYQPEGGYDPLSHTTPIYGPSIASLVIVDLKPDHQIAKWKLGQNRPEKMRHHIIEQLMARNHGNDHRAASEIQRWIVRNPA